MARFGIMSDLDPFWLLDEAVDKMKAELRERFAVILGGDFEEWLTKLSMKVGGQDFSAALRMRQFESARAFRFAEFYYHALDSAGLAYLALKQSSQDDDRSVWAVDATKLARFLGYIYSFEQFLEFAEKNAEQIRAGHAALEQETELRRKFRNAVLETIERLVKEASKNPPSRNIKKIRPSIAAIGGMLASDENFCNLVHPKYKAEASKLRIELPDISSMGDALNRWQRSDAEFATKLGILRKALFTSK